MTKAFLWFLLIIAVAFLAFGIANMESVKPAVLAFWALVGVVAAAKLFGRKRTVRG